MKKQLLNLILSGLFLITLSVSGQDFDYPIRKIKGVEYYVYTVQPKEGMYAISRKFGVKQSDINNANPDLDGLQVGQQILIPVLNPKKPAEKVTETPAPQQKFTRHKVEKKQTLFAISRIYNISQDDLKKYNPGIESGLREGMVLLIPVSTTETKTSEKEKSNTPAGSKSQDKKQFTVHVVKAGETLYSISNKYNVKMDDIIALNPEAASQVNVGSELKIPTGEISKSTPANTIERNTGPVISYTPDATKRIRIGFLLPFMLDYNKSEAANERFLDFYGGALVAIQEAKKKGISMEVFTYDTERSEEKLTEILQNPELKTMDLIIGPAFSNQVSIAGEFARQNRINTLIPFSSKVPDIENNPYLFQFNPGIDATLKFASELITGKLKNLHIVFADIPGMSANDEGKILSDGLKDKLTRSRKTFSQIRLTTSVDADFTEALKKGERNLIIFNTDKYAYVNPYINPLKSHAKDYNIVLFEQYSWLIHSNKLAQNLYISPFISNLNLNELTAFNDIFTQSFNRDANTDIPRFDLLGYDLTLYFVSIMHRFGGKFTEKLDSYNHSRWIQSQPLFERISNGSGFINQRLYLSEDNIE